MARPRKPKKLHILQGTDRADRWMAKSDELDLPSGSVGEPPDYLTEEGLIEWDRLTKDPDYSRVLSPAFRGVLIDYCLLHSEMVTEARGGEAMPSMRRAMLGNLRTQLGITPASQSKVHAPKVEKPKSKWSNFG